MEHTGWRERVDTDPVTGLLVEGAGCTCGRRWARNCVVRATGYVAALVGAGPT